MPKYFLTFLIEIHIVRTCGGGGGVGVEDLSVILIAVAHRVNRVLSFSPVVGLGTPTPSPASECVPPLLWFRGGGGTHYTLAYGRGGGGPIPTRGQTLMYFFLGIYVLCAVVPRRVRSVGKASEDFWPCETSDIFPAN